MNRNQRTDGTFIALALAIFALPQLSACKKPDPSLLGPVEIAETRKMMGTEIQIIALGEDRGKVEDAVEAAFGEIELLNKLMSAHLTDSDVSRINAAAGQNAVMVDPEVSGLVQKALAVSMRSQGAFDITMGALQGLWSFDPDHPRIPTDQELDRVRPLIDYHNVEVDDNRDTVRLLREGMRIDLGGIAKGYAADRAISILRSKGITMAMVSAGGDMAVMGRHLDRPWKIGIQDPRDRERIIASIDAENISVATSGDYERFVIVDGNRYAHIIDPRTLMPADKCLSVTVVAPEGWSADALATAIFVLGPKEGMLLAGRRNVDTLIIAADGTRYLSGGMKTMIQWEDSGGAGKK